MNINTIFSFLFDSSFKFIALWIFMSCVLILFNKAILVDCDFPYPMFLTALHMTIATILTQILARTTDLLPGVKEKKVTDEIVINRMFPIAVFFALSLVLSNYAYIHLSVAYIQMLKAFIIVVVLIMSQLVGLQKPSCIEFNIIIIVSLGIAMTTAGELNFTMTGFTFQCLAILFEACRLILVNLTLKDLNLDSLSTLYYNAPFCAVLIGLACVWFELFYIPLEKFTMSFIALLLFNGIVAFSLNISSLMLIKNTSALTLSLSGIVKDILLVLSSVLVFQTPVTLLQYTGYSISLLALNLHKEFQKNRSIFEGSINSGNTTIPITTSISSNNNGINGHKAPNTLTQEEESSLLREDV